MNDQNLYGGPQPPEHTEEPASPQTGTPSGPVQENPAPEQPSAPQEPSYNAFQNSTEPQSFHSFGGQSDEQPKSGFGGASQSPDLNGWQSYSGTSAGNAAPPPPRQTPPSGSNFQEESRTNPDYQWVFEDYDQISHNMGAVKNKSNPGLKIFAIVISIVFLLTAGAFAAFVILVHSQDSETNIAEESSTVEMKDGPQLSLQNRPAPDEEDYEEGVLSTEEIAATVRPSVVGVLSYESTSFPMQSYSTGSGIIMSSDGYIVTNAHVVSGATGIVIVLDNDEEYEGKLVGIDEKTDLAVVKIEEDNLTPAVFGNSDELVVGERVVAIGNPTGLNLAGSVTQGIVSGLERSIQVQDESTGTVVEMQAIQVDAAINPGNSGGALINKYGQVVGINSSKLASAQIEGIGFAIPISTAKPIVDDLIHYGYVRGRVLLGITYLPISDVTGAMSGYAPGLWVQSVREDLDVYAKGVRPGDVIVKMDDQDVRDSNTVKGIMAEKKPGDTIKLEILRQSVTGKLSTFTVDVELVEDRGSMNTLPQLPPQQAPEENDGLNELP